MTAAQALAFVEQHGIVLESARHPTIASLAQAIAGEPLRGGWWSHPKGRAMFAATRTLRDSPIVLVCRLIDGKITFAHERVWPMLVRLAERFPAGSLDRVREIHSETGAHRIENIRFPQWVPEASLVAAKRLTETQARATLEHLLPRLAHA